ncbi:MAG: hypothetical protein K2J72_02675 [Oscillospiraceae bacterium]|nr:hypothetical protein [Oscillospiraceae bacterium]
MKKNLDDIRENLEIEIDTAKALSEIMVLLHAGSHSFDQNEITFNAVKNVFELISEIADNHVRNLDTVANELVDFHNDLKIK